MFEFETVTPGSTGPSVLICQALLRALQYVGKDGEPIQVDGTAGENTVYAINRFQSRQRTYGYECGSNGENDGCFGPACWARVGMV